jgi:hypothetical protein
MSEPTEAAVGPKKEYRYCKNCRYVLSSYGGWLCTHPKNTTVIPEPFEPRVRYTEICRANPKMACELWGPDSSNTWVFEKLASVGKVVARLFSWGPKE